MITYGSVCSGIEAVSVAWEPLGFKPLWFSEIDPFPCAVLANHWPNTPNLGDMTTLTDQIMTGQIPAPDILVGGTPCQSFSVAGQRGSLSDERGNLTLELVRIFDAIDTIRQRNGKPPAILVWENVPGILSTKDNALGCFLGALAGESIPLEPPREKWTNAGFVHGNKRKIAWRVVDAQFFGVPQRRRRIFVVASARKSAGFEQILFEPQSSSRDIKTRSGKGLQIVRTVTTRPGLRGNASSDSYIVDINRFQTVSGKTVFPTLLASMATKQWLGNQEAFSGNYYSINGNAINKPVNSGGNGIGILNSTKMYTLTTSFTHAVQYQNQGVRRLTPLECERLQGFPDNHTLIPYRNKPAEKCPDTPRYKAIGNSMAVPVVRWIGQRIQHYLAS